MRKRLGGCLLLAAMLLVGTSCQEGSVLPDGELSTPVAPMDIGGLKSGPQGECDPEFHDYLEDYWLRSQHQSYTAISGVIDAEVGGTVSGVPDGWPDHYEFALEIPAGAVPPDYPGYPDIMFTIKIPVNNGHLQPPPPAVFELKPAGMQFEEEVKVTFCWPSWAGRPHAWYYVFCVEQEDHHGDRKSRTFSSISARGGS